MKIKILNGKTIYSSDGENIYQTLRNNGVYLTASCGGKGVCGKCRIKILSGKSRTDMSGRIKHREMEEGIVLACMTFPEEDILIEIPENSRLVIGDKIAVSKTKELFAILKSVDSVISPPIKSIRLKLPAPSIEDNISDLERIKRALLEHNLNLNFSYGFVCNMSKALRDALWDISLLYTETNEAVSISTAGKEKQYGLAIDIGTTTIVMYLVNCLDGNLIDTGTTYNSQIRYGDDVITRIIYATEGGGLSDLRNAVINDLNDLLLPVMERNGIVKDDIIAAVIAGNTTMTQLFWGIDPAPIREEPYIPAVNSYPVWRAGTAHININEQAPIFTMASVGSYVGGDIVSGVLASRMHQNPEIALFMDIGTNGEIVIGNNEWLITAACSAGPCFEGSGIRHGMRATEGAIEGVKIDPVTYDVQIEVIGNGIPSGICGSGMIDAISELFFAGIIDQKGKFIKDINTDRLRIEDEGPEFILYKGEFRDIVLTEVDIENILRAKAAIYAGVSVLLKEVGLSLDIIERVYIAGGFGNYLDIDKAIMIGMLPDLPRDKFRFIGNSSIAGAYLCLLSEKMRKEAEDIARKMTYMELSVSRNFMDEYMSALFLPHTNIDLFPTVRELYSRK